MRGGLGKRLLSERREEFSLKELKREHLSLLLKYLIPYGFLLFLASLAMGMTTLASLVSPYLTKVAIDDYILSGDLKGLHTILFLLSVTYGLFWLFSYVQTYLLKICRTTNCCIDSYRSLSTSLETGYLLFL